MTSPGAVAAREHVAAFDVLRTVAAAAVVVIHVLGPYRERLGEIADSYWVSAIVLNGMSRWSVPVFIMITGALLLADPRPFAIRYYLRRRVAKVLIPFGVWSIFYAGLAGFSIGGFEGDLTRSRLVALPTHETYYHLGFFYYFIPLYLLIPVLKRMIDAGWSAAIVTATCAWLVLTLLYLFELDGVFGVDLLMYGGYLLLGYVLFAYRRPTAPLLGLLGLLALVAVAVSIYFVISNSFDTGRYRIDRWFSYKTANTVLPAAFLFVFVLEYSKRLSLAKLRVFEFCGRYSLGVYLIHPLFLWPVREFDLYQGHPLLVIPFWTVVCGGLALSASWLLSRKPATAWLVP